MNYKTPFKIITSPWKYFRVYILKDNLDRTKGFFLYYLFKWNLKKSPKKINLCGGSVNISNYFNVDICSQANLTMDLDKRLLPFKNESADTVVCISAINYFSRERGHEIIDDVFRILKVGGITRFAIQDLKEICKKYINNDEKFFFEKLPNGRDRYEGVTMADKINSWFYGYKTHSNKTSQYMYDFETLSLLFKEVGFKIVERKEYRNSGITDIEKIDNRPEQMFFLEAIK